MKTAIITGVTGQDGSYLTELLLSKGYKVVGLKRRTSLINTDRVDSFYDNPNFILEYWDLNDTGSLYRIIGKYKPNEIYNLAAQSHVRVSFDIPEHTVDGVAMGPLRILEAIRNIDPNIKFYQASSSEMYGDSPCPKTGYIEDSRMTPASPYACAKLFSHNLVRNYRESYGMYACSGILFNHESERRGIEFVTRKISDGVARIYLGLEDHLTLGNLDAKRDWGYAPDYVEAMWLMLQQDEPNDYVISTGETWSIRDFLTKSFSEVGITDWEKYIKQDPQFMRPAEVDVLRGDSTKAREELGWVPKTSFDELVGRMITNDIKLLSREN